MQTNLQSLSDGAVTMKLLNKGGPENGGSSKFVCSDKPQAGTNLPQFVNQLRFMRFMDFVSILSAGSGSLRPTEQKGEDLTKLFKGTFL